MSRRVAFHIGYHKTATTWFQREALHRHPDVRRFLTGATWTDPFLREVILASRRDYEARRVREVFDRRMDELAVPERGVAIVSEERLSGHVATGGFDTFQIAERLAEAAPDARVFFVVREQVDMIESEYLQLVQEGSSARLDWLLRFTPTAATVPGFDLGHYEYDRLADHYVQCFGPERVRVFEFRSVVADPRRFLDEVADYLDIDPWPALPADVLSRRVNPRLPRRLLGLRRFLNHFERRPLNPHPVVALPAVWRGPLWWLASHLPTPKRPLLDVETRAELQARYAASNARLAERYGVVFPDAAT